MNEPDGPVDVIANNNATIPTINQFPPFKDPSWRIVRDRNNFPHTTLPAFNITNDGINPEAIRFQVNTGRWDKVVIPFDVTTAGFTEELRNTLLAHPTDYVLIIPFGSGAKLFEVFPNLGRIISGYIQSLLAEGESFTVAHANAKPGKYSINKYAPLIALYASITGNAIYQLLIRQQMFAINKWLAFHVIPISASTRSWTVGIFNTTITGTKSDVADKIRYSVMQTAWKDLNIRRCVKIATRGTPGPPAIEDCTFGALQSIDVHPLLPSSTEVSNARALVRDHESGGTWIVYMAPPGNASQALTEELQSYLHQHIYGFSVIFKTQAIEAYKKNGNTSIPCVVCKQDNHRSFDCLFAVNDPDFWGPQAQIAQIIEAAGENTMKPKPYRNNSGPRARSHNRRGNGSQHSYSRGRGQGNRSQSEYLRTNGSTA